MPKIIDCTKNSNGTFVPRRVRTQRNQIVMRQIPPKRTVRDNVNDFIEGVDAGMEMFEHLINRINQFGAKRR